MATLLLLLVAILPSILIMTYVYNHDKFEKEPRHLLILSFIWGMIATIPAVVIQVLLKGHEDNASYLVTLLFSIFVVGFSEEGSKFMFLRFFAYPKKEFNEPMDGVVYAVMVGMGFATLENVLYVFQFNLATAVGRAFTAVPAHGAFALLMGSYVGLAKFNPEKRIQYLVTGFVLAVVCHGLYDFFLIQERNPLLMGVSLIVLVGAILWGEKMMKRCLAESPFK
jgi:protease PrsW